MSRNLALHESQGRNLRRRVKFTGTTALLEGQGVCYARDTGTATSIDGSRDSKVELPDRTNNLWFAGVAAHDYTANASGQWIFINEPGSVCNILLGADATLGAYLTCSAATGDPGRFSGIGFEGRGSATLLQTNASGVLGSSLDGSATCSSAGVVTKTAAFTSAVVGDYVYVLGGATTASGATAVTVGKYTISVRTSDDAVTLSSSPSADAAVIAFYIVSATTEPRALAYLHTGKESGLTQWTTPITAAASTPVPMVGGHTFIFGGCTLAGDSTATQADGTYIGQKKGWLCKGTITTSDFVNTVTSGIQLDGSTTLASIKFDAANEVSVHEWSGVKWHNMLNSGATQA